MAAGCGPAPTTTVAAEPEIILVATERTSRGGRLVAVSADGARQYPITRLTGVGPVVDQSPIESRDGKWLVFSSNRHRKSLGQTNLWLVSAQGGSPTRLTTNDFVDRDPRLSTDGKWLYFSSDRGGSFDLYRAPLNLEAATLGPAQAITNNSTQNLSPSISPDGTALVYMAISDKGESSIWRVASSGGAAKRLTDGPADLTPAWGPKGRIAFASTAPGRRDADLYLMQDDGTGREQITDFQLADETGPRWSVDGRYLFAIGVYRSAEDGKPLLGSVVFVDMKEPNKILRALHDPSAVESRIGLAVTAHAPEPALMGRNAHYEDALREVIFEQAVRQERRRQESESKQKRSK